MHIKPHYQADYDVIVLGFGAAGATAARFAADHNKKVLLADAAPFGHEGGNTRYAGQIVGYTTNKQQMMEYYQALTYPMNVPYSMTETYVDGFKDMIEYFKKYLCDPVTYNSIRKKYPFLGGMSPEYSEFPGSNSYDVLMVHEAFFDAGLWKLLRQKVLERTENIDVWLNSRALHLIQDDNEKVIGVQIDRDHQKVEVHARKGVVLATGGFENNREMVRNYLGADHLLPLGSMYNKGDGIKMGLEVGARMWHMWNYEALGLQHGLVFAEPAGKRGRFVVYPLLEKGSLFTIADDGTRYFREDETNRHGHIYEHGEWRIPIRCVHPYIIFDHTKYKEIKKAGWPINDFKDRLVKAKSIKKLAKKIGVKPKILRKTRKRFDKFAKSGCDFAYGRNPKTMRPFDDGPYYAIKMSNDVLNTQGGPERDQYARVLNSNGEPIPHLYSAGELGGICANQYQGGNNLAECLIWGKIAGDRVSLNHDDIAEDVSNTLNGINDLIKGEEKNITLTKDQYLGESNSGIGGKLVVCVTYKDNKIKKVDIVENHESEDFGKRALKIIPHEIEKENSTDVDAVSGASATSRAIKEAVKNAINKAK